MRSLQNDIKKLKEDFLLDQLSYELKVSTSRSETEQLKQCASMTDVLIILELRNGD